MAGTITVGIPDKCYISPDPKREFPFEFYFHVTYGIVPKENRIQLNLLANEAKEAVVYPQITIGGFEQLLAEEKIDGFIHDLKKTGDDDWIIKKQSMSSNILLQYTGDSLAPDFSFRAATEKFISTAEKNNLITLIVSVRNFENIEDVDYIIHTKVDYTPWAKSLTAEQRAVPFDTQMEIFYECMGDDIDKKLYQNGQKLDSARSPYAARIDRPSLFKLEVFNQRGMTDELQLDIDILPPKIHSFTADKYFFSEGEYIKLLWQTESISDLVLEGYNPQTDSILGNTAQVFPKPATGEKTKRYTLRVSGYKDKRPYTTSSEIVLYQSKWVNNGVVSGFVPFVTFCRLGYNNRIFTVDGQYYYYAHPTLCQSADGLQWKAFSQNDKVDDNSVCLAADYYDGILYAMGKKSNRDTALYISQFDFKSAKWSYASAAQQCSSEIAAFAFSKTKMQYAQVKPNGITIVNCGDDGQWNAGTTILRAYNGTTVRSGDYCFYKDRHYAVMLCDNNCIYVYDCDASMEDVLFIKKLPNEAGFVSFAQTVNHLYIMAGNTLINLKTQGLEDPFSPPFDAQTFRPWLGADKLNQLFGVFPDQYLWTLKE